MSGSIVLRIVAVAAVAAAAVAAVVLIAFGGRPYEVTANFVTASQLVEGNLVKVAGEPVGKVETLELTDDGQAQVRMTIDEDYAPLRRGTRAIIRIGSLSGVANRYVDLQLGGADRAEIPEGGVIETQNTEAAVDIDQFFNTFDPATRTGVSRTIKLFAEFNAGRTEEANAAFRYLNPSLAASARLFREINRNTPVFERFIVEQAELVTDLAERDEDLAGLIANLDTTMSALSAERDDLGEAIGTLPAFLRRSNTTFVNLRAVLDDLDPLVEVSKPVVRTKLRPLFRTLRPFARDARPALRDFVDVIRRPGEANDLVELLRRQPAVERVALESRVRNGKERPGAFPVTRDASEGAARQFSFFRPYTPELIGWFDDFSHSGVYDALGGFSRSGLAFSAFTFTPAVPNQVLQPVPPELREAVLAANSEINVNNRCPGALERPAPDGSNPWKPTPDFNCDLNDDAAVGEDDEDDDDQTGGD